MRRLLALAVLVAALDARAQELSIFDVNDFVDPRELGAVATERGTFLCPCSRMLISRLITGWDREFVNISRPTPFDVAFAHLATSYYRGAMQYNVKMSAIRDVHLPSNQPTAVDTRDVPRHALTLQAARYRARGAKGKAARVEITWRMTHYHQPARRVIAGPGPETRTEHYTRSLIDHEYGIEYDLAIPIFRRAFLGSLSYTALGGEHPTLTSSADRSRIAYTQRFPNFSVGPLRLETSFMAAIFGDGIRFKRFGQATIRPSAQVSVPIGSTGVNLSVRYSPSFTLHRPPRHVGGGYDWNDAEELAIFVDRVVFARVN
jgi:hypothetical protein